MRITENSLLIVRPNIHLFLPNSENPKILLLLSTLWTIWNSCSTVVLSALLKLQERRRRRSAAAAGSQQLIGTRTRTSAALLDSMMWVRPRHYRGQGCRSMKTSSAVGTRLVSRKIILVYQSNEPTAGYYLEFIRTSKS